MIQSLLLTRLSAKQSPASLVTYLNPFSYLMLRKRHDLLSEFDTIYIDGSLLVTIWNLCHSKKASRHSFDMTSMAPEVFNNAINNNLTLFFIGAKQSEIEEATAKIATAFPRLRVSGYRNGYFSDSDARRLTLEHIAGLKPDIVVVGMGTIAQEKFLIDLKESGWSGQGFTCGGFFHQTARGLHYYPEFFNKYNLRWLYRIIDEPKLFKRYFFSYPKSLALFVYDRINLKTKSQTKENNENQAH